MENNQITLTEYADIKQEIRNSIGNVVVSFVEIGFYLKKIRNDKLYLEDGYPDIWEMAQAEFNLSRTVASRFMSINDKYSIDGNSPELQEQFKGFGKSALTEMLNLPVEDYELVTPDTKIEDIRELKEAERKNEEEQVPGQMSLIKDMPEVVPEADKSTKEEITISDVLREMFRPREMKEHLDQLVNMDPDSSSMEWWVNDFNAAGNRTFKKIPYFLFFYGKDEGMKIKNITAGTIEAKTYKDFYFMVRAAFGKETVRGTDVWMQAFGEEWKEQQRLEKEAEEKAKQQNTQKKQDKKPKTVDSIKREPDSEKPKEESETTENRSEDVGNTSQEGKSNPEETSKAEEKETESVDFIQSEVDLPEQPKEEVEADSPEVVTGEVEKTVCDIAQGFTVDFPAKLGENIYKIEPCSVDETNKFSYGILDISPYLYEVKTKITMYYHVVVSGKSDSVDISKLKDNNIFVNKAEAEKRLEELNGKEE